MVFTLSHARCGVCERINAKPVMYTHVLISANCPSKPPVNFPNGSRTCKSGGRDDPLKNKWHARADDLRRQRSVPATDSMAPVGSTFWVKHLAWVELNLYRWHEFSTEREIVSGTHFVFVIIPVLHVLLPRVSAI